jgi:hypothetical protein
MDILELILGIVKLVLGLVQAGQKGNPVQPNIPPSSSPLAQLLAQQQAADATACQQLAIWMQQQRAQEAVLLQQIMGPSPFSWF